MHTGDSAFKSPTHKPVTFRLNKQNHLRSNFIQAHQALKRTNQQSIYNRTFPMKNTHKLIVGLAAVTALAVASPAHADYHHGKYVYHHGHYGYYYSHRFYTYNAGPYPYYYGPYSGPGVVVAGPAPAVVVAPRRHRFFFFF
jgi:hypothetical protein